MIARRSWALRFAVLAFLWLAGVPAVDTYASHSDNTYGVGAICYSCHTLNPDQGEANTQYLNSASSTMGWIRSVSGGAIPNVLGCTYCHSNLLASPNVTDAISDFTAGSPSQHPVDRGFDNDSFTNVTYGSNTSTTIYMSNWDNSWAGKPADQIGCVDCHDVTTGATGSGPGGYPDHPAPGAGTRLNNPKMLRNVMAMGTGGHAPDSFCLETCHAAGRPYPMGHLGWGAYNETANGMPDNTLKEPSGTPLKTSQCADCHESHRSSKPNLMGEQRHSNLTIDLTLTENGCAAVCHDTVSAYDNSTHGLAGVLCEECHSSVESHRLPTDPKRLLRTERHALSTVSENLAADRLDSDFNGVIDDLGEQTHTYFSESTCTYTCHRDKHEHSGDLEENGTPGTASCLNCHNMHGKGIDNNAAMLRRQIRPNGAVREVWYWAGTDTYRADGRGICDVAECHSGWTFAQTQDPANTSVYVSDHVGKNSGDTDCTTCHGHSAAPGQDTPSFAPVCNTCHDHPDWTHLTGAHVLSPVHAKHAAPLAQGGYDLDCSACHYKNNHNEAGLTYSGGTIPSWSPVQALPGLVDIRFAGVLNPRWDNGAVSYPRYANFPADNTQAAAADGVGGTGSCDGLYCHGNSDSAQPWSGNAASGPAWNGTAPCGSCHGATAGDPPVSGAHAKHITGNGYQCQVCHYPTTTDGATVTDRTNHVDGAKDVDYNTASPPFALNPFTYAAGSPGTCLNALCHGNNAAPLAWNAPTQTCDACHGAAAGPDVNDFVRDNASLSKVSLPEYAAAGHGEPSRPNKQCGACHDSDVSHDNTSALSGPNPFRLKDLDGISGGVQFSCSYTTGCHETGIDGPATGVAISTITNHTKEAMAASSRRTWPAWRPQCVNCHDPHGDQAAGESSANLSMIQREVYEGGSFWFGSGVDNQFVLPAVEQSNLAFTNDNLGVTAAGTSFADNDAPASSVCQECHTALSPDAMVSFLDGSPPPSQANHPSGVGGNPGDCSSCHKHDSAFKPSGCNGCHGSTANGQYWPTGNPGAYPNRAGSHNNHVDTVGTWLYAETASTGLLADDAKGTSDVKQRVVCAWCHPAPGDPRPGTGETTHADYVVPADVHGDSRAGASPSYLKYYDGNLGTPGADNNTAATYDNGTRSCASARCHNNNPTPSGANDWGAPPAWSTTGCDTAQCHATPAASGGHYVHYASIWADPIGAGYPCSECHVIPSSLRHANGLVNLSFAGLEATRGGGNGFYDKDNNATLSAGDNNFKAYDNVYDGTCYNIYCHGGDNAWGGTDNTPVWNDPNTGGCYGVGACHGVYGNAWDYDTVNNPMHEITTGNHGVHFQKNDNTLAKIAGIGPGMSPHPHTGTNEGCAACHNLDGNCTTCHGGPGAASRPNATHADGKVDFRTYYPTDVNDPGTTLDATSACNNCHGTGVVTAKAQWDNATYALDCLTCHAATPAYTNLNATGRVAPNVGGDRATYGAEILGHNRNTGTYPSMNPAAGRTCVECHDVSIPHIDGTDNTTYQGNRLTATVPWNSGSTGGTVSGLCAACHTTTASPSAGHNKINTHGNTGFSGINHDTAAEGFAYNCDACHEPHGMTLNGRAAGTYNIYMIRPSIEVLNFSTGVNATPDNTTTTGPVYFESRSGANSFDDNTSADGNRLCVTCHANAGRPGNTTALNVSGSGGSHSGTPGGDYATDERGRDCSSCHNHNKDDDRATVDGLMPQQCNACHSYPGLDNSAVLFTNQYQMSVGHWDHAGKPLAGGTDNSHGFLCTVCHLNYQHNQSNIPAGGSWSTFNANTVNIRFDSSWNPSNANGPRYNGILADAANGTVGIGGGGACSGLYCHGDSASSTVGWGGSDNTPVWDQASTGSCGTCHKADSTLAQGNHPAHIDNVSRPYGPETSNLLGAGGNCSLGTGCHTKYGLAPASLHANNAKDLRSTATDNGEVASTLGATQVCQNCHSTYASSAGTGDTLVRTQANWDNASYKVSCITCHNASAGQQGTQVMGGGGDKAPNVEAAWAGNGHGASGVPPSGIDDASTTTDSGNVDQVPPVRCETCHDESGLHIGTAKDGSNPWRLDNTLTGYTQTGGLDRFCLEQCHTQTAVPPRHAWRVIGSGVAPAQSKDNNVHTHPTAAESVPAGKDRWMQTTSDAAMPVAADLATKSPPARSGASQVACVTCHDPHGVGTAAIATRTFFGANDNGFKMLRYKSGSLNVLCTKCHI